MIEYSPLPLLVFIIILSREIIILEDDADDDDAAAVPDDAEVELDVALVLLPEVSLRFIISLTMNCLRSSLFLLLLSSSWFLLLNKLEASSGLEEPVL